jgi:hypothetical protein
VICTVTDAATGATYSTGSSAGRAILSIPAAGIEHAICTQNTVINHAWQAGASSLELLMPFL